MSHAADDHYALLGVEVTIDPVELRRVWRRQALSWHPDRAGPEALATFRKILAAYQVLSDPLQRAAYDRQRAASAPARPATGSTTSSAAEASAARRHSDDPTHRTAAPGRRRQAPGVLLPDLSGPLNALIACGVARRAKGGVIDLLIDAREAATGGMATISMQVAVHCPDCGPEAPPVPAPSDCRRCDGKRSVEELFSAWLAVPPGVGDGTILTPSAQLRGVIRPAVFRVRLRAAAVPAPQ